MKYSDRIALRLLERFPFPVRRTRGDAKCDFFNKMWLDFTGRTLEQELGDGWAANIHPDDVRAVFQSYLKAFHAHELFELQYRLRRHDGQYRWIVESAAPFEDSEGKFAGYIGAFHDIPQDKQAEEELAMRQGQLEEAQALARLGSWSWDILTGALTWSDELYRVFGLDKEFWPTHQGFCQLLHPDDRALFEVSIERALNSRQPYDCDLRIVRGDGSLRLLHSRGRVIFDKTASRCACLAWRRTLPRASKPRKR